MRYVPADPTELTAAVMTAAAAWVVRQMAELPGTSSRQRWTLVLVCTAAFMLLLDITVVSVALASIQRDLRRACRTCSG
jgi:hypothetical protein